MSRPDLQVLLRPVATFPALAHRLLWGRGSSPIALEGQLRTAGASVYPIRGLPLRILPARSCGTFLGLAHHGLPVFRSSARAGDRGFEPDANRSLSIGNGTGRRLRTFKYRQSSSSSSQPHCNSIGLTWEWRLSCWRITQYVAGVYVVDCNSIGLARPAVLPDSYQGASKGSGAIFDTSLVIPYSQDMPRPRRAGQGGLIYQALNRANARLAIFQTDEDYAAFQRVLAEAVVRHHMRLLAYCLLANRFHVLLWPREDGDLSRFMSWRTMTHTQRWYACATTSRPEPVISITVGSSRSPCNRPSISSRCAAKSSGTPCGPTPVA